MARLSKPVRDRIGTALENTLPEHWTVVVGADGCAFVAVDQDGKKPPHEFHALGSKVIDVRNRLGGWVEATVFKRVPFPAGYAEGREALNVVCRVRGKGWENDLVTAIVGAAAMADIDLSTEATGEA